MKISQLTSALQREPRRSPEMQQAAAASRIVNPNWQAGGPVPPMRRPQPQPQMPQQSSNNWQAAAPMGPAMRPNQYVPQPNSPMPMGAGNVGGQDAPYALTQLAAKNPNPMQQNPNFGGYNPTPNLTPEMMQQFAAPRQGMQPQPLPIQNTYQPMNAMPVDRGAYNPMIRRF